MASLTFTCLISGHCVLGDTLGTLGSVGRRVVGASHTVVRTFYVERNTQL